MRTGLEPATPGVTGRYSNQLNYRTIVTAFEPMEGIEPTTPRLQITCSGQLSYIGIVFSVSETHFLNGIAKVDIIFYSPKLFNLFCRIFLFPRELPYKSQAL